MKKIIVLLTAVAALGGCAWLWEDTGTYPTYSETPAYYYINSETYGIPSYWGSEQGRRQDSTRRARSSARQAQRSERRAQQEAQRARAEREAAERAAREAREYRDEAQRAAQEANRPSTPNVKPGVKPNVSPEKGKPNGEKKQPVLPEKRSDISVKEKAQIKKLSEVNGKAKLIQSQNAVKIQK